MATSPRSTVLPSSSLRRDANEVIKYEESSVYILLSNLGTNAIARYHWGIFICVSEQYGQVYHAKNNAETNHLWKFEEGMSETLMASKAIITALQIAENLTEDEIDVFHKVLVTVPAPPNGGIVEKWNEDFSCRVWVKQALEALREAKLIPDVSADSLEDEARALAAECIRTGQKVSQPSGILLIRD